MAERILRNFINGEYVDARSDDSFDVIDPATEQSYASSPVSGAADVDAAYAAASAAFETWGESTPAERQLALFRIADKMEERAEEFADLESQDTGKPRAKVVMKAGDVAAMPGDIRHQGYSPKRSMLLVWENASPELPEMIRTGKASVYPVDF